MATPYVVRISSQKGGVGKTTIAVNLAISLKLMGHRVLIIDGDYVNPVVAFHLGMQEINKGFRSVLMGRAKMPNSVSIHAPTGLHVLGGEMTQKEFEPTASQSRRFGSIVKSSAYDFVVVDTPPGFSQQNFFASANEAAIVLTPDLQATANAMKLSQIFDRLHLRHNIVLNRVRSRRWELNVGEIEDTYGNKVCAILPEDDIVPMSIASHIPAFIYSKRCQFSRGMDRFSRMYSLRAEARPVNGDMGSPAGGIIGWLRRIIGS
ncbi:MAG: MinD/ParA family protein [Candidatus Micrarchaeota archaeon]|nr:MinD/ParA family protein [Candidatus Micrarchaeota archaeon]MDE1847975.1 MinD/ParA family protein [Candidatus Micrarchaeota archaeon]MDE1864682.1 MinD/ParA family protein [Candidatus Micrarchaeota archaeon]